MNKKGTVKLLTSEVVPTYKESVALRAIKTHTPGKWVFVDLETGNLYCWNPQTNRYVDPPKKAKAALKKALTDLS